jgi:hypothetical protein
MAKSDNTFLPDAEDDIGFIDDGGAGGPSGGTGDTSGQPKKIKPAPQQPSKDPPGVQPPPK